MQRINKEEVMEIKSTDQLDQFKLLERNRKVEKRHVQELINAIEENPRSGSYYPILVNERFEVIDGQHRLEAHRVLKRPIAYIVSEGLDASDARKMNAINRSWSPLDYAKSYALAGLPAYVWYMKTWEENGGLAHNTMITLLKGETESDATRGDYHKKFRTGQAVIADQAKSEYLLGLLQSVGEFYPHWKNRNFTLAFFQMIKDPQYDHERFLKKLELYGHKFLPSRASVEDYKRDLEQLYNYYESIENFVKFFN